MNVSYVISPHFSFLLRTWCWFYDGVSCLALRSLLCLVEKGGKKKGQLFLLQRIVYFGYYLHQKMKIRMMLETTLLITICIHIFQPHLCSFLPSQLTFPFSNSETLVDILPSTHPRGYTLEQRLAFTVILQVICWSAFLGPSLFLRLGSISYNRSLMILLTPINPAFQPVDRSPKTFALY